MTDQLLRRSEVEAIVGLKKSAIYDRISKGKFPEPEHFRDARYVRWKRSKIEAWLEDQLVC
ncbi:helix-turn-helix transcriptional regulator [Qipengyuania sp.]|uniref:helix-turn-helix transcriptional regulator n=1 Tax=Qipengyuania sp. TaxID=2004515 RepID=UPI003516782C